MCDYSLEMYRSRPARAGEEYRTHRFSSGSIGFVAPDDEMTVVCMAYDTRIRLEGVPRTVLSAYGVTSPAEVVFIRKEIGAYQDAVRFASGQELTLQQLGAGVRARIIDAVWEPQREGRESKAMELA